jgi:hypothetical protein
MMDPNPPSRTPETVRPAAWPRRRPRQRRRARTAHARPAALTFVAQAHRWHMRRACVVHAMCIEQTAVNH